MRYDLPTSLMVGGLEYEIRSDYRTILDICAALNDVELDDNERGYVLMSIFYLDFENMPAELYNEAIRACFSFINCGEEEHDIKQPKLMDWEQDFPLVVAPVNRILGREVRALDYMHWWTFISAYKEIGDCLFSQVVSIREKKAKGKSLEKSEREFYRKNRDIIDFKNTYTESEDDLLKAWGAK